MTEPKVLFKVASIDGLTQVECNCQGAQELFQIVSSFMHLADDQPVIWQLVSMIQEVKKEFPQLYSKAMGDEVEVPDFNSLLQQIKPENNN